MTKAIRVDSLKLTGSTDDLGDTDSGYRFNVFSS